MYGYGIRSTCFQANLTLTTAAIVSCLTAIPSHWLIIIRKSKLMLTRLSFTRLFGRISFAQEVHVQSFTSPALSGLSSIVTGHWGLNACVFTRQFARQTFNCPYQQLNVEKEAEYKVVKKAFLRLAMENHPDTAGHDSEKSKKKALNIFMKARSAFESIVEMPDGGSGLKSEHDGHGMEGDEFDSWLKSETGLNPFDLNLDADTLKEIADASASQAGLDR
jgi:hypothetical protein